MKFRGTIETDGTDLSIIKQTQDTAQGPNPRRASTIDTESIPYIHNLPSKQRKRICGRCVLIDLRRIDLLYCIHEKYCKRIPSKCKNIVIFLIDPSGK
ncbi:hypothetical protein F4703DRAFT_1896183 [Phycomyces blakesleeanus]